MGELDGHVALVTGAARGFGRAVALLLASEGASVALSDIARGRQDGGLPRESAPSDLEATAEEIRSLGRSAVAIPADVRSAADCQRMVEVAADELGAPSILVANAGNWALARAWEFTEEQWDLQIDVNLKGAWLSAKYVIPHMIERRRGKIVFVSSIAGLRAYPSYAPYIAAKHGIVGLTKAFAIELGPYNINVNAVCPCQMGKPVAGDPPDPVWENAVGDPNPTAEEFEAAVTKENLLQEGGVPDFSEVAESVLWLVSDRARLITGHALPVDAGWVAKRGG